MTRRVKRQPVNRAGLLVIPGVRAAEAVTDFAALPILEPRRIDYGPDLEREDWQTAAAAMCFLLVALLAAFAQLIGWVS